MNKLPLQKMHSCYWNYCIIVTKSAALLLPKTLHFNLPKLLHSQLPLTLQEIYGYSFYPSAISIITDKVNRQVQEWQNRSLEAVYCVSIR